MSSSGYSLWGIFKKKNFSQKKNEEPHLEENSQNVRYELTYLNCIHVRPKSAQLFLGRTCQNLTGRSESKI